MTKALMDRAMQAELTDRLGYGKHGAAGNNGGNSRNGSYESKIIAKGQTRYTGFDDKIISIPRRKGSQPGPRGRGSPTWGKGGTHCPLAEDQNLFSSDEREHKPKKKL